MNTISDIMFWISNGLLVPVVVLLILLFFRSLLLVGNFFGQYVSIRKTDKLIREQMDKLHVNNVDDFANRLPEKNHSLVVMFMKRILEEQKNKAQLQRLLAYNMQVAFATTVIGLVAGAIGFLTQQVKQRWYLQDMTNLECLVEVLNEKNDQK